MILFLRLVFVFALQASGFEGTVVGVIDGDTIEVMREGKPVRVRLNGIDCPEQKQAFGSKAKTFVSALVYKKKVLVKAKELDRYGRTIADVYLADGTWLNKKLVDQGLAWHYKRYSSDQQLSISEKRARDAKVGLWQDPQAIAPWEFRKRRPAR